MLMKSGQFTERSSRDVSRQRCSSAEGQLELYRLNVRVTRASKIKWKQKGCFYWTSGRAENSRIHNEENILGLCDNYWAYR